MASLNRVTGKVFAGEADLENIGIFGSAKAGTPTNNTDVATIQSLQAYLAGWTSGVVTSKNFPPVEEVNGALKTISYQACYCLQEGVAEYDSQTEYKVGSFCKVNNVLYASLRSSNIGHPVSDSTYWMPLFLRLTGGTLTGNLTVSKNSPYFILKSNQVAGTAPSETDASFFAFRDSNDVTVGYIQNQYNPDGSRYTVLNSRNADGSNNTQIAIGYDSNGNIQSYAPNPSDDSNNNNIATTMFVKKWAYGKIATSYKVLASNASLYGSTPYEYDLSNYLPNDYSTYNYEVYVGVEIASSSSLNNYGDFVFTSSLLGNQYVFASKAKSQVNNVIGLSAWAGWIPIGTDGMFYVLRDPAWNAVINNLCLYAYRRLN